MEPIYARSVSEGLAEALYKMTRATAEDSRNGPVLVMPEPVITVYTQPQNRVLFSPMRDANPFFHLMESLWMLAGRNDIRFPASFNSKFIEYSDDGVSQWGAYGYRWRKFFGYDQLKGIVTELRRNPNSRRAVLSMWNGMAVVDEMEQSDIVLPDGVVAANGGKDVPCNTHAYFDLRGGALNMTVCNRSNDAIWGAYGANAVHFSVLLEYLAAWLEVPVGVYRQFSNNLHVYTDVLDRMVPGDYVADEGGTYRDAVNVRLRALASDVESHDRHNHPEALKPAPLFNTPIESWDNDLKKFFDFPNRHTADFVDPFFKYVAQPMYIAHSLFRRKDYDGAITVAQTIRAWDWHAACGEWLYRRKERALQRRANRETIHAN